MYRTFNLGAFLLEIRNIANTIGFLFVNRSCFLLNAFSSVIQAIVLIVIVILSGETLGTK
jgi:hypothetical protein